MQWKTEPAGLFITRDRLAANAAFSPRTRSGNTERAYHESWPDHASVVPANPASPRKQLEPRTHVPNNSIYAVARKNVQCRSNDWLTTVYLLSTVIRLFRTQKKRKWCSPVLYSTSI